MKPILKLSIKHLAKSSITDAANLRQLVWLPVMLLLTFGQPAIAAGTAADAELEQFKSAWTAAGKGDHDTFNRIRKTLPGYILFPYLQYENYREQGARAPVDEMAAFLDSHQDWAFTSGLRTAWLKSLAKKGRWADLVAHSDGVRDTALRCQRARGKIILRQTDGVLNEAKSLWLSGKSQPKECDTLFTWLIKNNGVTERLAWQRIELAMREDNRHMTIYLARFVPRDQRDWLDEWQRMSRAGYTRLERARKWPNNKITRMITATSLQRLARKDAALAARKFQTLDGHFSWDKTRRAELLREIALYSAVALEDDTVAQMTRVPLESRDSQLLEWWARFLLSREDWPGVAAVIDQLPAEVRTDDRWRYWMAQAELRSGKPKTPSQPLSELATRANYYGFLAADELGLAYNICPQQPQIEALQIERLAGRDNFRRALELRKAALGNWAIEEWSLATRGMTTEELRTAAALANRENWHDRAIFALGNSGDLQYYEWRFPLAWEADIKREATTNKIDPGWVYGTIRSESAMMEAARSSANALGLMQVTPTTGKQVAKKHKLAWAGSSQLKTAAGNLPIGTAYMRDLLKDYQQNPVLVSGAYNAGPNAVKRWLKNRPMGEAAIWVETLPYMETRDYIPRVLAFTALYEWRLGGPVKRVSVRMPHIESGKISVSGNAPVMCVDQNG